MSVTITTMGMIKTQIKRELWENKTSFFYAPMVVSGFVLILMLCGLFYVQKSINKDAGNSSQKVEQSIESSNDSRKNSFYFHFDDGKQKELKDLNLPEAVKAQAGFFGAPIIAVIAINGALLATVFMVSLLIYSSSCLFDDRKNRDILFWRSMPVSETTNVLVKLAVIVCVAPLVILTLSLMLGVIAFLVTVPFAMANGVALSDILRSIVASDAVSIAFKMFAVNFLMLIVVLPIYSFNLLCSSFAKRSPFFTGALIPIVLIVLDKLSQSLIGLNLHVLDAFKSYGNALSKIFMMISTSSYRLLDTNTVLIALVSFVAAVLFLWATIWLRNNRYEI